MNATSQRDTFGWHGIRANVPRSWEPLLLEGTWRDGFARLSDFDSIRLELRWNRMKDTRDCDAMRDRMLSTLSRASVDAKAIPPLVTTEEAGWFRWRDDELKVSALGRVSLCTGCDRALLGQVIFPDAKEDRAEARRVLGGLSDHALDGESTNLWRLYGFSADVDSGWALADWTFSVGLLELVFERRGGELLRIRRWGPAEVILADGDFDAFHQARVLPRYGPVDGTEVREVAGHRALYTWRLGAARGPRAFIRKFSISRVAWTKWNMRSLAWHCPQANRIFVWEHACSQQPAERDWRVQCHEEGDAA